MSVYLKSDTMIEKCVLRSSYVWKRFQIEDDLQLVR